MMETKIGELEEIFCSERSAAFNCECAEGAHSKGTTIGLHLQILQQ